MTYAKTQVFEADQQLLALFAKALGHPARIAIVELLAEKGVCISGDISSELPLSRTTVSQHLQELKQLGIIKGEVDGLNVCYCLDYDVMNGIKARFLTFFEKALVKSTCC